MDLDKEVIMNLKVLFNFCFNYIEGCYLIIKLKGWVVIEVLIYIYVLLIGNFVENLFEMYFM